MKSSMKNNKTVLVTGGAGYLGSVLVPYLISKKYSVTVLDNFMYKQNSLLDCCHANNLRIIRGDCRDEKIIKQLLKNHDITIPLAALVGAPICNTQPDIAKEVNFKAVKILLKHSSKNQMILYPTTNSGYGIGTDGIYCTEKTPLKPISLYGRTKVDAEKLLLDSGNAITFRLATVFGISPRMRLDLLVNDFVYRAVTDRCIVLFESHFKRNFIHIRDVASVFHFGIENYDHLKGEAFNVGLSDANLSKLELCQKIKEYLSDFHYLKSEIGKDPDKRNYIVSNEKIECAGFKTKCSLDRGIKELIKGYQIIRKEGFNNL